MVFEFCDHTVLNELDANPKGYVLSKKIMGNCVLRSSIDLPKYDLCVCRVNDVNIKKIIWQTLRAVHYCHQHNVGHFNKLPCSEFDH